MLNKSKVWVSSLDVLNGQWVQVYGNGCKLDTIATTTTTTTGTVAVTLSDFEKKKTSISRVGICHCTSQYCKKQNISYTHDVKVKWE